MQTLPATEIVSHAARAFDKQWIYDPETRDFAYYLDGELVGFARTAREAEDTLNAMVYEILERAYGPSCTPPVEEAAEVEALPAMEIVDEPGLSPVTISVPAGAAVAVAEEQRGRPDVHRPAPRAGPPPGRAKYPHPHGTLAPRGAAARPVS